MKLRSVALVGVVCIATLGLIGAGARAVFTTSTTSGQTITAGTGWTTTHAPTRLITSSNTTTTTTDPTAPTASITYPVDGTTYGADWTGTITGTASSGAGTTITATAMVAIEDTTTNQWWNGTSFAASTQSFVTATGNTTWLLGLEAGSLTSGDSYSVIAEATDSAGNVGTSSTVSFTYGTASPAPPTVSVTYPVDGTSYGADWTGTITGTASTTDASTQVAIEDTTADQWWSGTSFSTSTQTFVPVSGTTTWLLGLEAGSLTSGDSYSVVAQATDSAGKVGTSSPVKFTYGTAALAPPTVSVTYPVDGTTYGADWTGTITGTASSGASTTIAGTQVAIEDTSANMWWNGTAFAASTQSFVTATGNTTWLLGLEAGSLTSGDSYSVVAQATDSAGNLGTSSTVSFTYNSTAQALGTSNG